MAVNCPVCDHEIESPKGIVVKGGFLITDRGSIPLGYTMETVMKALVRDSVTIVDLVEMVYGSREASPNDPNNVIQVGICRLKPRLVSLGWDISNPLMKRHDSLYQLHKIEGTA